MVLATWWYEDGPPPERPGPAVVEATSDRLGVLAAVANLEHAEVGRRLAEGHRAYLSLTGEAVAAYGWVATARAMVGELDIEIVLPPGNRYLWDFTTLPAWRGRGVYRHLLAEIVRRESPPATRLWIIHAPENRPSGRGIARAGFRAVADLSFSASGHPALRAIDTKRAAAGAALLGLPLVAGGLSPCWRCGAASPCACPDRAAAELCQCHQG